MFSLVFYRQKKGGQKSARVGGCCQIRWGGAGKGTLLHLPEIDEPLRFTHLTRCELQRLRLIRRPQVWRLVFHAWGQNLKSMSPVWSERCQNHGFRRVPGPRPGQNVAKTIVFAGFQGPVLATASPKPLFLQSSRPHPGENVFKTIVFAWLQGPILARTCPFCLVLWPCPVLWFCHG